MRIGRVVLGVLKALYASLRRSAVFRQHGELLNSRSELNTNDCRVFSGRMKTMYFIPFTVSLRLSWVIVSSLCLYLNGI